MTSNQANTPNNEDGCLSPEEENNFYLSVYNLLKKHLKLTDEKLEEVDDRLRRNNVAGFWLCAERYEPIMHFEDNGAIWICWKSCGAHHSDGLKEVNAEMTKIWHEKRGGLTDEQRNSRLEIRSLGMLD